MHGVAEIAHVIHAVFEAPSISSTSSLLPAMISRQDRRHRTAWPSALFRSSAPWQRSAPWTSCPRRAVRRRGTHARAIALDRVFQGPRNMFLPDNIFKLLGPPFSG